LLTEFPLNKNRTKELMQYLEDKGIFWKCSTRIDCIDEEILELMKKSGCKEIAFGIESADEEVLDIIGKKTNILQAKHILILLNH
jgi:radical SAM superfamily enzyme YgiQ (UPF0313 family)